MHLSVFVSYEKMNLAANSSEEQQHLNTEVALRHHENVFDGELLINEQLLLILTVILLK